MASNPWVNDPPTADQPWLKDAPTGGAAARSATVKPKTTQGQAVAHHLVDALTFGHGDELRGLSDKIAAGVREGDPGLGSDYIPGPPADPLAYEKGRDAERSMQAQTQRDWPKTVGATQFGGRLAADVMLGTLGVPASALAIGGGALAAEGDSQSSDPRHLISESLVGGLSGLVGYVGGSALGKAAQKVKGWAGGKVADAAVRINQQASEEVAEKIASARGVYGKSKEVANRIIENLIREEQAGTLTPANAALLASMKKSPEWGDIINSIISNNLADAPGTVADQATKKAVYQALLASKNQDIAARAQQLAQPQFKADAKTFAKGWLEPVAWALAGQQGAEALGLEPTQQGYAAAALGLIGGRTRAGKALMARVNRPGNVLEWAPKLAGSAATIQNAAPWAGVGLGQALQPIASASGIAAFMQRAIQGDPVVGQAAQDGGKQEAAAAMYGEQQRDPQRFAQIRQAVK